MGHGNCGWSMWKAISKYNLFDTDSTAIDYNPKLNILKGIDRLSFCCLYLMRIRINGCRSGVEFVVGNFHNNESIQPGNIFHQAANSGHHHIDVILCGGDTYTYHHVISASVCLCVHMCVYAVRLVLDHQIYLKFSWMYRCSVGVATNITPLTSFQGRVMTTDFCPFVTSGTTPSQKYGSMFISPFSQTN